MPLVDSHCHASPLWYEPVETLLYQMDTHGVHAAVLIQMQGQFDNSYQQACLRRYPGRFASVVLVDHERADAAEQLRRLAEDGASGVRLKASDRSPGDDPLELWRVAQELKIAVSCPVPSDLDVAEFGQLLQALPDLQVVLEHLAGVSRADANGPQRDSAIEQLARWPNVTIKVPGLGEVAQRALPVQGDFPFQRPIPSALRRAFEAFGPERMMWGSDFPPVAGREGYGNALRLSQAELESEPPQARAAIFGEVAARVFPIR
ncbi:MAG TPA: amidohydrolase family protein [Chloroflexota bacterium]|jgi:L-fuconolactonase